MFTALAGGEDAAAAAVAVAAGADCVIAAVIIADAALHIGLESTYTSREKRSVSQVKLSHIQLTWVKSFRHRSILCLSNDQSTS